MQASIEHADTHGVLVLIKLTGSLHADEAGENVRLSGLPCVDMGAGYNPNIVAELVISQVGERLIEQLPLSQIQVQVQVP